MELLLIRHAVPERITTEQSGGEPADPSLTDAGRHQADRLAAWLAIEGVDHIVSSPLRRAGETAAPVATALGIDVEVDPELCEYDAAADSYIPIEEMRAENSERWQAMVEGRWADYGGEPPDQFRGRIIPCIDRIIAAHPGRKVAAVCHGGVINVYLASVLDIDRHLWFDPEYTSISRVRASRSGARSIESINERAHLVGRREQQ
ncbi:MAG: histidine phosphatase family protein [Acidimicrobiia bacterium]|nr:histidine phosphatase family protein [Acidimicrobiia bacterium]